MHIIYPVDYVAILRHQAAQCTLALELTFLCPLQMAGILGRFSPSAIAATAVGGAAIIGGYLYSRQGIQAGASPGQLSCTSKHTCNPLHSFWEI